MLPRAGQAPRVSNEGIDKLLAIVARRFEGHGEFFGEAQLRRLAQSSGGDLRDFFRMARLAITHAASAGIPLTDAIIEHAEDAVRRDMLPIAADDREWLVRIAHSHSAELPSLDRLPELARLQEGKYVLQFRNGENWYAVHPLLQEELCFPRQRWRPEDVADLLPTPTLAPSTGRRPPITPAPEP